MLLGTKKLQRGREIFKTLFGKRWSWSWIYLFIAGRYLFEEELEQIILELALEVCWIKKVTKYWVYFVIFYQAGQQRWSGRVVKVDIKHPLNEGIKCILLFAAWGSFSGVKII